MKYVGIAIGAVILYFAWKVSQDTGAMLIAAGWAIGMASAAIGGLLAILAVRAVQPKRGSRDQAQIVDGTGWQQMPRIESGQSQPLGPGFVDSRVTGYLEDSER